MEAIVFQGVTIDVGRRCGHVWLDCGERVTSWEQLIGKIQPAEKIQVGEGAGDLTEIAVATADGFFSRREGIEFISEWIFGALDGF